MGHKKYYLPEFWVHFPRNQERFSMRFRLALRRPYAEWPIDAEGPDERAAQRNPSPSGPGQASYLSICGKELAAPYRSGESPSPREGVLQKNEDTFFSFKPSYNEG